MGQVGHITNDLIRQLDLVHCAYQLVQLEGVDAVVEYVERGLNWVVLGIVMVLSLKALVVQVGHAFFWVFPFWVVHKLFYVDND